MIPAWTTLVLLGISRPAPRLANWCSGARRRGEAERNGAETVLFTLQLIRRADGAPGQHTDPAEAAVRQVGSNGENQMARRLSPRCSASLVKAVARGTEDGCWQVRFFNVPIGIIDRKHVSCVAAPGAATHQIDREQVSPYPLVFTHHPDTIECSEIETGEGECVVRMVPPSIPARRAVADAKASRQLETRPKAYLLHEGRREEEPILKPLSVLGIRSLTIIERPIWPRQSEF